MVSQVVETLAYVPKQEKCKVNMCFMGFEAKEGETKKELVQWLNTELLQGQMRLRTCQGCCCHVPMAYDYTGLRLGSRCVPQRGVAQVYNE